MKTSLGVLYWDKLEISKAHELLNTIIAQLRFSDFDNWWL